LRSSKPWDASGRWAVGMVRTRDPAEFWVTFWVTSLRLPVDRGGCRTRSQLAPKRFLQNGGKGLAVPRARPGIVGLILVVFLVDRPFAIRSGGTFRIPESNGATGTGATPTPLAGHRGSPPRPGPRTGTALTGRSWFRLRRGSGTRSTPQYLLPHARGVAASPRAQTTSLGGAAAGLELPRQRSLDRLRDRGHHRSRRGAGGHHSRAGVRPALELPRGSRSGRSGPGRHE
jgi:hypothetical protein